MRKAGGIFTAIAAAAAMVSLAATASDAATRSRAYDGLWSVSIFTKQGPCSTYRYPARIVGGLMQQAEPDFTYQISGGVNSAGGIIVTVSSGGQSATGRGHLNRTRGVGVWKAAGGQCSGVWNADRRGIKPK
jgi:hypothetical protein